MLSPNPTREPKNRIQPVNHHQSSTADVPLNCDYLQIGIRDHRIQTHSSPGHCKSIRSRLSQTRPGWGRSGWLSAGDWTASPSSLSRTRLPSNVIQTHCPLAQRHSFASLGHNHHHRHRSPHWNPFSHRHNHLSHRPIRAILSQRPSSYALYHITEHGQVQGTQAIRGLHWHAEIAAESLFGETKSIAEITRTEWRPDEFETLRPGGVVGLKFCELWECFDWTPYFCCKTVRVSERGRFAWVGRVHTDYWTNWTTSKTERSWPNDWTEFHFKFKKSVNFHPSSAVLVQQHTEPKKNACSSHYKALFILIIIVLCVRLQTAILRLELYINISSQIDVLHTKWNVARFN